MPSPFESAQLNLQLFELRREPLLREARSWFVLEFNPQTLEEFLGIIRGERNSWFRMVIGYWDMAASMVTSGAIDADSFRAAHGEVYGMFCKIQPFLAELRTRMSEPDICRHVEAVVMGAPDAEGILTRRRGRLLAAARAREAAAATQRP